ncbi:Mediator of DNA damage checkpoint protein 1 [Coemansia sp. S3946]|nr:Mediator of DNA damage checkpoint protein 1 [Coemansia sp. S3946]
MAALCLHSSPDDSIDGPLEVSLYAGLNNISGSEGSGRIVLPIVQAINAAIEIDDGLHVLYDYGSAGGVFLGHRRARVKRDAGYVISDGKLLWFGEVSFWYRVLDGSRRSKSPTPPWRDTHVTPDVSAFLHGDTMHASPRLNPHSSPLDSTHTREKPFAEHLVLSRARATLLRREEAVAVVSQSPDPQSSLVLTSPPGQFSPTRASPDRVALYPVSLLDDHVLGVDLIGHSSLDYDSDPESMAMDTEPLSQHSRGATPDYCPCSSPPQQLAYAASPALPAMQLDSVHTSLRMENLHVGGGSVLAPGSDDDERQSVVSKAATEVIGGSTPEPEPEPESRPEAPSTQPEAISTQPVPHSTPPVLNSTQPVSPSRLPPQRLTSGSRHSSVGDALFGRKQSAELNPKQEGSTQTANPPAGGEDPDSVVVHFPKPPALLCAPTRVILAGPSYLQQAALPRYPYDLVGMEAFLRSATQNTAPTQPDIEYNDGLEGIQLSGVSVGTMQSSDFSQQFISPPPPPVRLPPPCAVETGSSRMSIDSTPSPKGKSPALTRTQSSVSSVQASVVTPANTRRLATSKRHRRSIDNYTDEEEEDERAEDPVVVSETPAKRNTPSHAASRSGSRLSATSTLSLSSSSIAISSARSSQRFNTPTYMSSRVRHSRHTPLNLKSSNILHVPPPRIDTPSRTPLTRGSHGRSSISSNYPSLPPTAPLVSGNARSAGIEVSRPHTGRMPSGTSNDGFPDDDMVLGSMLGTQGVNRANRGHRRYTQGSATPSTAVNRSYSPIMYPHTKSPVPMYQPAMAGVLESPMSIDSPTTAYTRPSVTLVVKKDEPDLSSSPDLPNPKTLMESIVAGTTASLERTPASKNSVELGADLTPTCKDEASRTAPTATSMISGLPKDREPVDVDDTQLDHEDSIVPEKPPPRLHLRVPTKSTSSLSSAAASTTDVLVEMEPTSAAKQPATTGEWISMDDKQSPNAPARPTRATALRRGKGKACGRGGSDAQMSSSRTPSATSTISPAASRSNSLADSLRKLPGKPGSKRTGLLSSKRTPIGGKKTLPSPVAAKGTQSASESPTPKVLGVAARALTATLVAASPKSLPLSAANDATLLQQEPVDIKPARVYGGKQRACGSRISHRNLDLAQTTPTKPMLPKIPPKRKNTNVGGPAPTAVSAARLTRQNSSDMCGIRMVAITGFLGDDMDQTVRKLESHGLAVTDNPLIADICIRQGKLGRTLKVLCALARGIPVVSPNWVSDLGSVALRTRSTSSHKTLSGLADTHLLIDRATEREWGFTLTETLHKAREMSGRLLAGYCIYITPNFTRPDPASLSVMIKSAGGFVLNDFGRHEERILRGEENTQPDPQLSRRSASATTAPDLPTDHETPTLSTTADCVLAGELTESSTEPDNASDEDWDSRNDKRRSRRTSTGGITTTMSSGYVNLVEGA